MSDRPKSEWHLLGRHLADTAELARRFAEPFQSGEWAALAGLWHDLGKYSREFQLRLDSQSDAHCEDGSASSSRVDHSTAGALHAVATLGGAGKLLAYLIAGHHAGLPDWQSDDAGAAALSHRLAQQRLLDRVLVARPPAGILARQCPSERPPSGCDPAFWIRMLFSCLVDADFLDSEAFFSPERGSMRKEFRSLKELEPQLQAHLEQLVREAAPTKVNAIRRTVLERCRSSADWKPGAYSLTVPTGGGKTLASLAFAIAHAVRHEKQRVLYVIPYTSIIEQTADVFRRIFGDDLVEHHSALDIDPAREDGQSRLASENWDAPLVVTTSVQFFESLFASRSSRCRKLHNIANSVIVLDEVQLLPPELLKPILFALRQLRDHYGSTLLLTTATQPALGPRQDGDLKFEGIETREIVEDPEGLHEQLRRVELELPEDLSKPVAWSELASELGGHESVLAIVNRRRDAFELHRCMPAGTFHLSGLMCGAHRTRALEAIRQSLRDGLPTKVVSTQLVEAGVDLDFPVVYRALAGLDSIAQAAGRCNREGRLRMGRVRVFVAPAPKGHLRMAQDCSRKLLSKGLDDPLTPGAFRSFFRELYWLQGERLDAWRVLECLPSNTHEWQFRTASRRFRMIDDEDQAPLVIPYEAKGRHLVEQLRKWGPNRELYRGLQRLTVQVSRRDLRRLVASGDVSEMRGGLHVLGFEQLYDPATGLRLLEGDGVALEPEGLIL
ncbi:MAG: CRISPR-associated helicase Cas3' [Candidatus Wallbacteria bacterium]|nr:CRISPR-associated helicase Cas3' [Candidatus Wallbacteria bacterium]